MIHSCVGYCPCGAEIWIEYLPAKGHGSWQVRFFDGENNLIAVCPDCQREIKEEDLASR